MICSLEVEFWLREVVGIYSNRTGKIHALSDAVYFLSSSCKDSVRDKFFHQ